MTPPSKPSPVFFAASTAAVLVAHQITAKATRDGLFLGTYGAAWLPEAMMIGGVVSLAAALVSAWAMNQWGPERVLYPTLALSALGYLAEAWMLPRAANAVAVLFYMHVAAVGSTLIAAFWAMLSERYDPRAARDKIARIAAGGALGGVLGGALSWLLAEAQGPRVLLILLAGLNLVPALTLAQSGSSAATHVQAHDAPSAVVTRGERSLLGRLALLVGCGAAASALLDYALGTFAAAHFGTTKELTTFFALFHLGVGLAAFIAQTLLAKPTLERWGLAVEVALLPLAVAVGGVIALTTLGLFATIALRGFEGVIRGSLYRSGYELFYTPLSAASKRFAKMVIDIGVDRVGTIGGSAVAALALAVLPASSALTAVVVAVVLSALVLFAIPGLYRGYVGALQHSLETGAVALSSDLVLDATTRRTLAETQSLDRRALLAAIEEERSGKPTGAARSGGFDPPMSGHDGFEVAPATLRLPPADGHDPVVDQAADLRSGDRERVQRVLSMPSLPRELVPHAILLLGDDRAALSALGALRKLREHAVGQLWDALVDRTLEVKVRRRIPRVLEACPGRRALEALTEGLFAEEFQVRFQCTLSLLRATEKGRLEEVSRERIFLAALEEIQRGSAVWEEYRAAEGDEAESPLFDPKFGKRASRGIELVMLMLSVVLEREPLRLAYRALFSSDTALRGTAIEYLDNVLPDPIKRAGMPFLDELDRVQKKKRAHADIVDVLLRSGEIT